MVITKKTRLIFILILIFLLSFLFEKFIFNFLFYLRNLFLTYLMLNITYLGNGFVVGIIATSLFFFYKKRKFILPTWFIIFITGLVVHILKILIARQRPDMLPLVLTTDFSFPSSHTAVSFSILAILNKEFRKFRWAWLVVGLFVAFSRIYLGAHYLSDVIAGGIVGYLIGLMILKLFVK